MRWSPLLRQALRPSLGPTPRPGDNVIMAMSGGVDSSVSAALLKQQGFNVRGIYMRNWDSRDENGACPGEQDWEDVEQVCDKLGIQCEKMDFVKEYWHTVFEQTLDDYAAGLTPNPDISCNQHIKFGALLARVPSDAWLATGHYCRRSHDGKLLRGLDAAKDQSYYLSTVRHDALRRTLFPLGEFHSKAKVKAIAQQLDLHVASKRESMGICFVGQRKRFADFLAEYIDLPPGPAVDLYGKVIGTHQGLYGYTIGQASRICHGSEKWFVAQKLLKENTLVCVPGGSHPALFHSACEATNWIWLHPEIKTRDTSNLVVSAQVRYRQQPQRATLTQHNDERVTLRFDTPVRAIAQGQQVVVWDGDWCLGSGVISRITPAYPTTDKQ